MFNFQNKHETETSKCYVTHGTMGHLDRRQPPTKRKPYSNILALPFVHKVELILPTEFYERMKKDIDTKITAPVYSRVILSISALLEGEFFNEYIKKGDVLMLSEGDRGVDDVFSLKNGILTLYLCKESYERAGLSGKPDGAKGMRGPKPRWTVEINLRLPSMLHGKKGFDRIVYSFKNTFKSPVTWLFTDLRAEGMRPVIRTNVQGHEGMLKCPVTPPGLLKEHFPVVTASIPDVSSAVTVKMPRLHPPLELDSKQEDDFNEFAVDLYEWLSLISLGSPRVDADDQIDPFLSRYSPPEAESTGSNTAEIVKVTWKGFLSPLWIHSIFVETLLVASTKTWFSLAIYGFDEVSSTDCRESLILKLPGNSNEYILWELGQI